MGTPPFVLPLFRYKENLPTASLLGTGVLVAPDRVLTCSHVVHERDGFSGRVTRTRIPAVRVGSDLPNTVLEHEIETDAERDLALLHLTRPLNLPPVPLLAGISREFVQRLLQFPWHTYGYPQDDNGLHLRGYVVEALLHGFRAASNTLADIQLRGGIPEGVSGGPVMLSTADGMWACLGLVYRGGKNAATSRIIPSDLLLEFLGAANTTPSLILPVERALARSSLREAGRRTSTRNNLIFISYARADGEPFARDLHIRLQAEFEPWLDVFDIPAGADWDKEIDDALAAATVVLVVLTPGAVISQPVKSEWSQALNRYTPVIPLLVKPCSVPRLLAVLNYLDFSQDAEALPKLFSRLQELPNRHLDSLRDSLVVLQTAQKDADEPRRFAGKIATLEETIANWPRRIESQQQRVECGLEQERQSSHAHEKARRARFAGARPPSATDRFKGRLRERQELGQLLAEGRYRMITLLGRGGMGKSALACNVLLDLEQNRWPHASSGPFVDGIVYLSTRTQGITLEQLFLKCAEVLGGEQGQRIKRVWASPEKDFPLEDKVARLLEALSTGLHVILLDNAEDILDPLGHVSNSELSTLFRVMVSHPHRVRFLLTSREPFELADGLLRPHEKHLVLREGLLQEDAVALLRELDPNAEYGLADAPEKDLLRVVSRAHGVPRALELMVSLLANNWDLSLDEALNTFYRREEVVQKLVEENFRRLDLDSRRTLQALAVLGRPVKPLVVDYLLQATVPGSDVPGILRRLVRAHAVNADRATGQVALHPIDQEFALNQLADTGAFSRQNLHLRAAEYYRSRRLVSNSAWVNLDDLAPHFCEFDHLVQGQQFDEAARLLAEFGIDLAWRGSPRQCRTMADRLQGHLLAPRARLAYLACEVALATLLGPIADAGRDGLERLRLAKELDDPAEIAFAHWGLVAVYRYLDQPDRSVEHAQQALDGFHELGMEHHELALMHQLSWGNSYRLNVQQALKWGRQGLVLAEKRNDLGAQAAAHDALSLACLVWGQWQMAIEHARQAVAIWGKATTDGYPYTLNIQGMAEFKSGEVEAARRTHLEARLAAVEVGSPRVEGISLHNLAVISYLQTDFAAARDHASQALVLLARMGIGTPTEALLRVLDAAQVGDTPGEARALFQCARASAVNPDLFPANELATRCYEMARTCGQLALEEEALAFTHDYLTRLVFPEE